MKLPNRPHCCPWQPLFVAPVRAVSLMIAGLVAFAPTGAAQDPIGESSAFRPRVPPSETAAAASGSSTVALTTSMEVLNDSAKLGPGDRVSFRIVEEKRAPIGLIVTDSGEMEVPLIGRVVAKGRTCKQLAYALKPLLEKEYFYTATVIVGVDVISTRSRGRIYITGQVRSQGAQELPPDELLTVSKAILRAGGFLDFANKKKVKLVRKASDGQIQTTIVDLAQVLDRGQLDKDPVLEPGDLINIPERLINF